MQFSHHFRNQSDIAYGALPRTTFGTMTVQKIAHLIESEHAQFFPADAAPQITVRLGCNRHEPVRHYTTRASKVGKNSCYIDTHKKPNNPALLSALKARAALVITSNPLILDRANDATSVLYVCTDSNDGIDPIRRAVRPIAQHLHVSKCRSYFAALAKKKLYLAS